MSNLDDLRKEVEIKRRRATSKVSRLRSKGVEITKSDYDPRRNPKVEKRYTEKQLRSYIAELDAFNSRTNQYVPGLYGNPIPRQKWEQYKRLENAVNLKAQSRLNRFKDIKLPGQEITIEQRDMILAPAKKGRPGMPGVQGGRPINEIVRESSTIKNVNAVDKLIMNAGRKLTGKYANKILRSQRTAMQKMMDNVGVSDDIKSIANDLPDEQFDMLWNYTSFPTSLSLTYGIRNNQVGGISETGLKTITENSMVEIEDYVKWAGKFRGKKS